LKTRLVLLLLVVSLFCLAGLGLLAFNLGGGGYRNLLLAAPSDIHAPLINIQKVEQICEDEFLLTYEILEAERVVTSQAQYPVTIIGTNSFYPRLLGLSLTEGSFFTKQAWDGKQKHAVLNETAAFAVFGSSRVSGQRIKIGGDTWIVTGVVNDGDDETSRVYVPSSVRGGGAASLLALMESGRGITEARLHESRLHEAYIKDSLKSLGVQNELFTFYNLETRARLYRQQVGVVLMFLCCLVLIMFIPRWLERLKMAVSALQGELKNHYPRELLKTHSPAILKAVFPGLLLAASAGLVLFLLLRMVSICLPWQDLPPIGGLDRNVFYQKTAPLRDWEQIAWILFAGTPVLSTMACFFIVKDSRFPHLNRRSSIDN
jgi:hypothetical protein